MSHSNLSTDGSNNNQHFQTFLQDYLSDLIRNSSTTEGHRLQNTPPSNYYINPLYRRARRMPLNLFIPENSPFNIGGLQLIEMSGISFPSIINPRNHRVDTQWGDFMESLLQHPVHLTPGSSRQHLDRLLQRSLETTEKKLKGSL